MARIKHNHTYLNYNILLLKIALMWPMEKKIFRTPQKIAQYFTAFILLAVSVGQFMAILKTIDLRLISSTVDVFTLTASGLYKQLFIAWNIGAMRRIVGVIHAEFHEAPLVANKGRNSREFTMKHHLRNAHFYSSVHFMSASLLAIVWCFAPLLVKPQMSLDSPTTTGTRLLNQSVLSNQSMEETDLSHQEIIEKVVLSKRSIIAETNLFNRSKEENVNHEIFSGKQSNYNQSMQNRKMEEVNHQQRQKIDEFQMTPSIVGIEKRDNTVDYPRSIQTHRPYLGDLTDRNTSANIEMEVGDKNASKPLEPKLVAKFDETSGDGEMRNPKRIIGYAKAKTRNFNEKTDSIDYNKANTDSVKRAKNISGRIKRESESNHGPRNHEEVDRHKSEATSSGKYAHLSQRRILPMNVWTGSFSYINSPWYELMFCVQFWAMITSCTIYLAIDAFYFSIIYICAAQLQLIHISMQNMFPLEEEHLSSSKRKNHQRERNNSKHSGAKNHQVELNHLAKETNHHLEDINKEMNHHLEDINKEMNHHLEDINKEMNHHLEDINKEISQPKPKNRRMLRLMQNHSDNAQLRKIAQSHANVLRLVRFLEQTFTSSIIVDFFHAVTSLSFALFHFQSAHGLVECAKMYVFLAICIFHQFLNNYFGEIIKFWQTQLSYSAYETPWYTRDRQFKRSVQMITARSHVPILLNGLKMYVLCLASFVEFMRRIFSYYTVLREISK